MHRAVLQCQPYRPDKRFSDAEALLELARFCIMVFEWRLSLGFDGLGCSSSQCQTISSKHKALVFAKQGMSYLCLAGLLAISKMLAPQSSRLLTFEPQFVRTARSFVAVCTVTNFVCNGNDHCCHSIQTLTKFGSKSGNFSSGLGYSTTCGTRNMRSSGVWTRW